jgi:hypothetical protein
MSPIVSNEQASGIFVWASNGLPSVATKANVKSSVFIGKKDIISAKIQKQVLQLSD